MSDSFQKHPFVVGIYGPAGAGKNTFGEALHRGIENSATLAFADRLKEICAESYGVPLAYFHDRERKDSRLTEFEGLEDYTPRDLCVRLGAAMRAINPDVFVGILARRVVRHHASSAQTGAIVTAFDTGNQQTDTVIITDVRMRNEYDYCNKHGIVINLYGRGETSTDIIETLHTDSYVSVCNSGSRDRLVEAAGIVAALVEHREYYAHKQLLLLAIANVL